MESTSGLVLSTTHSIHLFLSKASKDPLLSEELRQCAADLFWLSNVPYAPFRSIWIASDPSNRPNLISPFYGSHFVLYSPRPRRKSEELKARLKKHEDIAERDAYEELVKDISPRKDVIEPLSAYKNQLGFGLHVVLTIFTGYVLGHALSRASFSYNPAANAVGVMGVVGGMLVETFLSVIGNSKYDPDFDKKRNSKLEIRSSISGSRLKKNQ